MAIMLVAAQVAAWVGTGESVAQSTIRHPTAENIPRGSELTHSIPMDHDLQGTGPLYDFARTLKGAREALAVGVAEGADNEMFGTIADIAPGESGGFFVLDASEGVVYEYDSNGRFVEGFGQFGEGPGEFRSPVALAMDYRGKRIVVADRNRKVSFFNYEPRTTSFDRMQTLKAAALDLCIRESVLYTHGTLAGIDGTIHVPNLMGAYVNSFGAKYVSDNPMVAVDLSRGFVTCNRESVVFGYLYLPVVRGYTAGGELLWTSILEEFQPLRITEDVGAQTILYSGRHGTSDVLRGVTMVEELPFVIVQVRRRTPESIDEGREYARMFTYVLDSRTGEGAYVGTSLPPVYAVKNGFIYTAVRSPFPQVRVYDFQPDRP